MINKQLINPKNIAIIGASNNIRKPGGKIVKNIIDGGYKGELFLVNPKEKRIQGHECFQNIADLPQVDLAIIVIPAKACVSAVDALTKKEVKAYIVISAGFSELGDVGIQLEKQLVDIVNKVGGVLIGPNCIGVLTPFYKGIFTEPIPKMAKNGVDLISGSGATAVFIMEYGIQKGLTFLNIFSVGNSAQIGAEDVLEHLDNCFVKNESSTIKLLYLEKIEKPQKLLKHAQSLIKKGCRVAAIKSGNSESGSRAASSHTGAMAGSDKAVEALFRKAGIVRCKGGHELIDVACIFKFPKPKGKRFAVITHAGGPGVMLTDTLEQNGLKVPIIDNEYSDFLLEELYDGSSVSNPIDFLATGTAEQLNIIIEYVEKKFDEIDAMIVIFGSPGLNKVFDVYDVLSGKIRSCRKPIYPVLPSIGVAKEEIEAFVRKGNVYFLNEIALGESLAKVLSVSTSGFIPNTYRINFKESLIKPKLKKQSGYLQIQEVAKMLDYYCISRVEEAFVSDDIELKSEMKKIGYPLAMKVSGPIHKTDMGGVVLGIDNEKQMYREYERLMQIKGAKGVVLQAMIEGEELFIGAKYEEPFGHLIMCGIGGVFVELLNDVAIGLAPLNKLELQQMLRSLKSYQLFKGVRGKEPIDEDVFIETILKMNKMLIDFPEIKEIDFNPLIANGKEIKVVDARIFIDNNISQSGLD